MTEPTESLSDDRPAVQRIPLALVLTILGMFFLGVGSGVIAVAIAKGGLPAGKAWLLVLPVLAFALGFVSLRKAWRLAAPPRHASGFERRYWKMWMWVFVLGAPLGMASVLPVMRGGERPSLGSFVGGPFSNAPIPPGAAFLFTLLGLALCIAAFVIYHRTIDEQEERGYLWGSQIAFYFLSLAFPAWWVLQRGGVMPALDAGAAVLVVLASFVIQAAVWAWFKFR